MQNILKITINPKKIEQLCKKWHISRLALFGSVLTDAFTPKSDVDFLAQFEEAHVPSFFDIDEIESELTSIIGRRADLRTPKGLSHFVNVHRGTPGEHLKT
jgi:predicted nucleotidyltransferase